MPASFTLDNGLERHLQNPENFDIPTPDVMMNIKSGDIVKLIFRIYYLDDDNNETEAVERMWVIVKKADFPFYEGVLDNDPYCTDELKSGEFLKFEAQHIIDIYE